MRVGLKVVSATLLAIPGLILLSQFAGVFPADENVTFAAIVLSSCLGVGIHVLTRRQQPSPRRMETTPAWSVTVVVLMTGLASAIAIAKGEQTNGLALAATVIFLTAILAILAHHFASRHADSIGEAQFRGVPKQDP